MERATIEAPAAPDFADGAQRRAWLIFQALQGGIDLAAAMDQAELAEAFIVTGQPRPKLLPAPTLTQRAEDLVAEAGRVKARSDAVLSEAEAAPEVAPALRVSAAAVEKVLVAVAAYGPKVSNVKLRRDTGLSQETLRKALLRLRQLGRIRVEGKGTARQLHVVGTADQGSEEPEESDPVAPEPQPEPPANVVRLTAPDPVPDPPAEPALDPAANAVRLPAPTARPTAKQNYGAVTHLRNMRPYIAAAGVRFRTCQYIAGEPIKRGCSDHLKCGRPTVDDSPYCAAHLAGMHVKREPLT